MAHIHFTPRVPPSLKLKRHHEIFSPLLLTFQALHISLQAVLVLICFLRWGHQSDIKLNMMTLPTKQNRLISSDFIDNISSGSLLSAVFNTRAKAALFTNL